MGPETRVPPLRWIFPLAQLFLCAVILWPMRSMLVGQIRTSLREYGTSHDTAARNPVAPRLRPFNLDLSDPDVQRRIRISEAREWAVAALNMPGALPDLTYAILSPAHSEWTPRQAQPVSAQDCPSPSWKTTTTVAIRERVDCISTSRSSALNPSGKSEIRRAAFSMAQELTTGIWPCSKISDLQNPRACNSE